MLKKDKLRDRLSEVVLLFLLSNEEGISEDRYEKLQEVFNDIVDILNENEENCDQNCRNLFQVLIKEYELHLERYRQYLTLGIRHGKFISKSFMFILHNAEEYLRKEV